MRPLREAVPALPGFQFGDIAEDNLSRSLDEVQLTLDEQGVGRSLQKAQWKEVHSPLQLILQPACWNQAVVR
ncbi:protein YfhM [Enterobacter cloacae]|uniref:Protein YfhM n=1 Tax=Enterobacter cloacae TaxID=550 RepID=A0A377LUC0_ENTCL|nr:protein YfhM [Enterobacter cloacae]